MRECMGCVRSEGAEYPERWVHRLPGQSVSGVMGQPVAWLVRAQSDGFARCLVSPGGPE